MNYVDFKCDTTRLTEDADNIINLLTNFNDAIYDFYRKLEFLSYEQTIWNGKAAKSYYNLALREKKDYDEYSMRLKEVARSLKDYAYYLENTVYNNERSVEDNYNRY